MRKATFIFIAIIIVAASIDWVESCSDLKSHKEVFSRQLTYADMYEYTDADYDYVVRVPSFFTAQPDSLKEEKGRMRFEYGDQWITIVIESHVTNNNGQSLKSGMDSLAQVLHSTNSKLGSDPDGYKDVLARMFKVIDDWQIWERPRLQLKQGESQTPKALSNGCNGA